MMLSHYLGIKMHTLDVRLRDGDIKENAKYLKTQMIKGANILIVDDINDTGATFKWIKDDWNVPNDSTKSNVKFAALIDNLPSDFVVEYNGVEINKEENVTSKTDDMYFGSVEKNNDLFNSNPKIDTSKPKAHLSIKPSP